MVDFLLSEIVSRWALGIPAAYAVVFGLVRSAGWEVNTVRGTDGAVMIAYETTAVLLCLYVSIAGCLVWLNYCSDCDLGNVESDKMYGRSLFFEQHICVPLMCYQFWNFIFCLVIDELRQGMFLVHHMASGLCAFNGMHPFLQYYGMFFCSLPEITSVPLGFICMTKHFPFLKGMYPRCYDVNKWLFGVFFLIVRIFLWTYFSVLFWIDIIQLLQQGEAHSVLVVVYSCFANVILSTMQYFWGYKIVIQMLGGKKMKSKKKKSI